MCFNTLISRNNRYVTKVVVAFSNTFFHSPLSPVTETFTSSPIRFCAAHDLCSLSGNQHRRQSIPSGNPSLVRSFLVFLSVSKEAYIVYFICSPMAAAIYVSTALSDYIEIGSNATTTTTTKKTYIFTQWKGWGDLGDITFGLFLFSECVCFPIYRLAVGT